MTQFKNQFTSIKQVHNDSRGWALSSSSKVSHSSGMWSDYLMLRCG